MLRSSSYLHSHVCYQSNVRMHLRLRYPDLSVVPPACRKIGADFFELDLHPADTILAHTYPDNGRPARWIPSQLFRSLLLMYKMKCFQITQWADRLRTDPFVAIVSGFNPLDTPRSATFYEFLDRLWRHMNPNAEPHLKPLKLKRVDRPKGKNQKADSIEPISVADLISRMEADPIDPDDLPTKLLFDLFLLLSEYSYKRRNAATGPS